MMINPLADIHRLQSILQDKSNVIENLNTRYRLGILPLDPNISDDNISYDKIDKQKLQARSAALAQRTILENMELREIVNELRDENFHCRNTKYELLDKLKIAKIKQNTNIFDNLYRKCHTYAHNESQTLRARVPDENNTEMFPDRLPSDRASLNALLVEKENIIHNLTLHFFVEQKDIFRPDDELCLKAQALAQRTVLENFELREMITELRDENSVLITEIIGMSTSPFERLHIDKRQIVIYACIGKIEKEVNVPIDIKMAIAKHCNPTDEWNKNYFHEEQIISYGTYVNSINHDMNTFYGNKVLCSGCYSWRLRIMYARRSDRTNIYVGFVKNKLDVLNKFVCSNEWFLNGNGYVYCGRDMKVGYNDTMCEVNKKFQEFDDVLEIMLDLNERRIYISVNNEKLYVPKTFECIDRAEYRLVITVSPHTAIQLL